MKPLPAPILDLTAMKRIKRIAVTVAGVTVLAVGIALVVLPGPAVLAIPAGLAILAIEFAWAKRWLRSTKDFAQRSARLLSGDSGNPKGEPTNELRSIAWPQLQSEEVIQFLDVDESPLTGESVPVEKHTGPLALDTILAERKNLAFAGTMVTYGQAEGIVWAIGDQTELGRIARLVLDAVSLSTPLTRKIAHFSKLLLVAILALAALTFAVGLWRGEPLVEVFMAAVALAVAAIPEGLPAAVTIALAIGVSRMAKRRAIIRKLPAVETLGSTTVICSDKTGTLTENQMTVQRGHAGGDRFEVTGGGYEAEGEIRRDGQPASAPGHAALFACLRAGLFCNDSQLVRHQGRLAVQGDPTEAALILAAQKAGLTQTELRERHPRLDVIPFESEHQYMATLHGSEADGANEIFMKGSVEQLIEPCASVLQADGLETELDKEASHRTAHEMAAQGLRVLAFARRRVPPEQRRLAHTDVAGGLTLLGLQGMMDPPREEAIAAVHKCRTAGICVKMITGDHLLTAKAVAEQIGLNGAGEGKAQLVITYLPLANRLFHTAPLSWDVWLRIVSIGAMAGTIVAFEKWVRARRRKRNPAREGIQWKQPT